MVYNYKQTQLGSRRVEQSSIQIVLGLSCVYFHYLLCLMKEATQL